MSAVDLPGAAQGGLGAERIGRDTPGEVAVPAELHVCHSSTGVDNVVDNFPRGVEKR